MFLAQETGHCFQVCAAAPSSKIQASLDRITEVARTPSLLGSTCQCRPSWQTKTRGRRHRDLSPARLFSRREWHQCAIIACPPRIIMYRQSFNGQFTYRTLPSTILWLIKPLDSTMSKISTITKKSSMTVPTEQITKVFHSLFQGSMTRLLPCVSQKGVPFCCSKTKRP